MVKDQDELPQDYLTRVENTATALELAVGERQIGVRLGQPDKPVSFRRIWQDSGVPKEWQELQLMKILEKAGMLAPEML